MKLVLRSLTGLVFLGLSACIATPDNSCDIVDDQATPETKELLTRLRKIPGKGFLIGQEDATSYGVGWGYGEGANESDMKSVCGDFPAVYGFDIGLVEYDWTFNLDTVNFALMQQLIREAYERKGVITISWHVRNPVTDENAWSQSDAIRTVLTDTMYLAKFKNWLGKVAEFFTSLKDSEGKLIPVLFRPWHELNGSWFWWGGKHCTREEFVEFWKLTVTTLRDSYGVHNLLYAFSPNVFHSEREFMDKYPGDDYVDLLGLDIYVYGNNLERYSKDLALGLAILKKIASVHDKPYALTETGFEGIPDTTWYTQVLYPVIRGSGISYVLFWRNANSKHHYVPYPGHRSAGDFRRFYELGETLFNGDI